MKQTAVEWLIEKLYSHDGHIDILDVACLNDYWGQAKEMEKKQILDAWISTENELQRIAAEKYYQETYGKKMINLLDSNPINGHSFMNHLKNEFDKPMKQADKAHLQWIHDRIVDVYGENENVDFLIKMREIISNL